MKTDIADLEKIAAVINEPGFKCIEKMIREKTDKENDLVNICGVLFYDGMIKGKVEGRKLDLFLFEQLRGEVKEMEDK